MKMFCFKFQQNCTINEEYDFLRGGGGGREGGSKGTPIYKCQSELILVSICKCSVSKFSKFSPYMNNLNFLRSEERGGDGPPGG